MAALAGLLRAPDPRRMPAAPQQRSGVEALLDIVESATQDPLGQELVRGLLSSRLGVAIPTRDELDLKQAQVAQAQQEYQRKQRSAYARDTLGLLVDASQAPADQIIPQWANRMMNVEMSKEAISMLKDQTLEQALNSVASQDGGEPVGPLDQSLIHDPHKLTRATEALASIASGDVKDVKLRGALIFEHRLGFADTLDFDITKTQATKTKTDLAREELGAQAETATDMATVAKGLGDFQTFIEDQIIAPIEARTGDDLSANVFGRGHLGEARGASDITGAMKKVAEAFPALSGQDFLNHVAPFLESREIPQIITEGSDFVQDDEGHVTIVPKDPSAAIYLKMLFDMSMSSGKHEKDYYLRLGIPADRSDRAAVDAMFAQARRE